MKLSILQFSLVIRYFNYGKSDARELVTYDVEIGYNVLSLIVKLTQKCFIKNFNVELKLLRIKSFRTHIQLAPYLPGS